MMDHHKQEHSRSSVGLAVIRCTLCFVFVIVFIPVLTTLMVLRDNDNPGISIWWLQPIDDEDLVEEESDQIIATQLKLRKWAKKQKELALAFVNAGLSKSSFCVSGLSLKHLHTPTSSVWNAGEPTVWDAVLGKHGAVITLIITPPSSPSASTNIMTNHTISSSSLVFSMPTRVTCRLYDHRSQHLTTVLSLPIIEQRLVRCPVPYDVRDKVFKRHNYHSPIDKAKMDIRGNSDGKRTGSGSGSGSSSMLRGQTLSSSSLSSSSLSENQQHQQRLRYEVVNTEIKVRLVWSTTSSSSSSSSTSLISSSISKSSLSTSSSTTSTTKSSPFGSSTANNHQHHNRIMLSSAATRITTTGPTTTTPNTANIFSRNNSIVTALTSGSSRIKNKNKDKTDKSHPRPSPLYPVCALPHLTTLYDSQQRSSNSWTGSTREKQTPPLPGWSAAFGPDRHGRGRGVYHNTPPPLQQQQEQQPQPYGIALCSTTSRGGGGGVGYNNNHNNNNTNSDDDDYLYRKQLLVEWLEYHRLIGVDHFFLYDTVHSNTNTYNHTNNNTSSSSSSSSPSWSSSSTSTGSASSPSVPSLVGHSLRDMLRDYLALGLVTIVPWHHPPPPQTPPPYQHHHHTTETTSPPDQSPASTLSSDHDQRMKTLALTSCYTRFRSTTRWMISLTPDEFLGIDINQRYKGQSHEIRNLPSLLAAAESHHRHLAAVEFTSLAFLPCAPTPIADPYTMNTDKNKDLDQHQDKGLAQHKDQGDSHSDKGSDKGHDKELDTDKGIDKDQESLLSRILHNGVLGAFTTFTTDTSITPTPPVPTIPRTPLTLNNKGDEENSPVSPRFGNYLHARMLYDYEPLDSHHPPPLRVNVHANSVHDARDGVDRTSPLTAPVLSSLSIPMTATVKTMKLTKRRVLMVRTDVVVLYEGSQLIYVEQGKQDTFDTDTAGGSTVGRSNGGGRTDGLTDRVASSSSPYISASMSHRQAKRAPPGRPAVVGEYYVAEMPMSLAAVMHFRVAPLTQGQGLDSSNHNTNTTNGSTDTPDSSAGVVPNVVPGKASAGVVVASSLDLAGYDVLDLPLGSSPHPMYLHSSPLSLVCRTTTTTTSSATSTTTKGSNNKDSLPGNKLAPTRSVVDPSLRSSPSLSLEKGGVRFHDRYSRHVEELLGDRYLRAMKGQPPEGDGPEEVDDDE